jgi:hypothetical protein
LLDRRIEIIADHALHDRDPEAHLESLKQASESLANAHARLKGNLPPRLEHFLSQCSYQKAQEFLGALLRDSTP